MIKTQNRTLQSNITVNPTSHPPSHKPFLILNTLNKEFSTTDYCVTLNKDFAIASVWGPWVFSWYLDWKTWIWSQSSSRAVVVDPSVSAGSLLLICSQVKSALTWSCPAPLVCDTAMTFNFIFSSEDQLGYRIVSSSVPSSLLPKWVWPEQSWFSFRKCTSPGRVSCH